MVNRQVLWPIFVVLSMAALIGLPHLPRPYSDIQLETAAIGTIWALAFYLHRCHGEDARFLKELMESFNARYRTMNDDLQRAIQHSEEFSQSERLLFINYFNLCAEEWLFWKQGYIIDPVWSAWRNGMSQYGRDPRVRKLWAEENATGSYYGFEFPPEH